MNQKRKNNKNTIENNAGRLNTTHPDEFHNEISNPIRKQFIAWPCKSEKSKYQTRTGRTKGGGYVAYP